jgi:hypothetical protein
MRSRALSRAGVVAAFVLLVPAAGAAQWLNYPTPGTPRLPDGSPDLSAPAPRTSDGTPDLSGIWNGGGALYRFNIAKDLEPEEIQPWAYSLFLERVRDSRKDSPLARCLPVSVAYHNFFFLTRIVQTPSLTMLVHEGPHNPIRTIFTDGRDLPEDPNPAWLGYSIGRWEGDTLVVTTAGFSDATWLDSGGIPQTESLRVTERFRRRDFGHMDYDITIDDPTVFTRPFTIRTERSLAPDTQLLESICENERDAAHMVGHTRIALSPELLATYAGVYEIAPGREAVVTARDDLLIMEGLGEPRLPLLEQSETKFVSTTTAASYEFVIDAQGTVTHMLVGGRGGVEEAVRKD